MLGNLIAEQFTYLFFCRYSGAHPGMTRNISQDWHHFHQSSHSYVSCFGKGWLEIAAYAAEKHAGIPRNGYFFLIAENILTAFG